MTLAETQRIEAVNRYIAGDSISDICNELKRSRKWFYKWKNRYESDPNGCWYKDQSRAPKTQGNRISSAQEDLVVSVRQSLESEQYARIGPQAIDWQLRKSGFEPPSITTIKRVIKRNGLVKRSKQGYRKKGTPYPNIDLPKPNTLHAIDFWGPRHLRGGHRFYCLNVMDISTRRVTLTITERQRNQDAKCGLANAWERLGVPKYAKFDNALAFRGSNRHPRSFGPVIRWCLMNDVQPIFIPIKEPWRNGHIEKFHSTLENQFFRQNQFTDHGQLTKELLTFQEYHNNFHRYSPLQGRTPKEEFERSPNKEPIRVGLQVNPMKLRIPEGKLHVIRLIRSDLKLDIFGEKFQVPSHLKYEYVVATISTSEQKAYIFNAFWELELILDYSLNS